MKKTLLGLLLATLTPLALAASDNFTLACEAGGQKNIGYTWNIVSGEFSYTASFVDCKPDEWAGIFNGTISGAGTLRYTGSRFDTDITYTEDLTVSGLDSGNITCTTTITGQLDTAGSGSFAGTLTKNNCTFSVSGSDVNIVDILTQISFAYD